MMFHPVYMRMKKLLLMRKRKELLIHSDLLKNPRSGIQVICTLTGYSRRTVGAIQ